MTRFGRGASRAIVRLLGLLAILGATGDAAAQVNERDRLERCANNRERMLDIQRRWPANPPWSDEQIARARTAMRGMINRRTELDEFDSRSNDPNDREYRARRAYGEVAELGRPFGLSCEVLDIECMNGTITEIGRRIDQAVIDRDTVGLQRAALRNEFAVFANNYVALGCTGDPARQLDSTSGRPIVMGSALIAGTYDSSFGTLTMSEGGGSYDYYGGQVQVATVNGNVVEGT